MKTINYVLAGFLILFLTIEIIYLRSSHKDTSNLKNTTFKVETFMNKDGWGYQVKKNGKVYIYQPFIPCMEQKKGFPDELSARRAGLLVLDKLTKGQVPSLNLNDLKMAGAVLGNYR